MISKIFFVSLLFILISSMEISTPKEEKKEAVLSGGVSMYEISTRPWLYELSQKYGKSITRLQDIPDEEFQVFVERKFDYVWFMGVWHLGPYGLHHDQTDPGLWASYEQVLPDVTVADVIGSPYAVTNYTCNPELGSDDDIMALKQKLNGLGIKLMLDFVPNHTAVDCPWTTSNTKYYVTCPQGWSCPSSIYLPNGLAFGSSCYGCGAWTDTAQLNYWNPDLRNARTMELMKVASLADGIRCDVAYLALNDLIQQNWGNALQANGYSRPSTEWWSDAISAVKSKFPDVIFLGEVYYPYEPNLQQVGFDYTYDKNIYDKLKSGNLDDVRGWLSGMSISYHQHSAHFVSNHDEPRSAAFFGNWWNSDAAALLTFTIPGMRFYWMWEELGYKNKLDVHLRREESENSVSYVGDVYNSIWNITSHDVFKYGTWTYLNVFGSNDSWRLVAYRWEYQNYKRLCVINFSESSGSGSIIVSNAEPVNGNDNITITDLLSNTSYTRSASQMRTQGLFVVVNSWFAQIFEY